MCTANATCTTITLARTKAGWMVERDTHRRGPYLSDELALRVAMIDALELGHFGQPAKVSVQTAGGEVATEYCLCAQFSSRSPASVTSRQE